MSNLTPVPPGGGNLPAPAEAEEFERTGAEVIRLGRDLYEALGHYGREAEHQALLAKAMRFVEDGPLSRFMDQLRSAERPATVEEIAEASLTISGCFPTANRDIRIYARMLPSDVAAKRPSVGALDAAVRSIRRTSNFLPSIAEVLTAIDAATTTMAQAKSAAGRLDRACDDLQRELEQRATWRGRQAKAPVADG